MNQVELVYTPACYNKDDQTIVSRWVATESPVIFGLQRRDYNVISYVEQITSPDGTAMTLNKPFTGIVGDKVTVINILGNVQHGEVVDVNNDIIVVDITGLMDPAVVNNNTEFRNFHFEGRVIIDGEESISVVGSPDARGYGEIDISGLLRTKTSQRKSGDYSSLLTAERTKSGSFTFEYRGAYWGSDEEWIAEETDTSPAAPIVWNYVEAIRSEEQGSNLAEYVATELDDAPFLNTFEKPVYFRGLPFDISFILPKTDYLSINVTIQPYNSSHQTLGLGVLTNVSTSEMEGYVNSLRIREEDIPSGTAYFTVTIEAE